MSTRRKLATAAVSVLGLLVLSLVALHFYLRWETARVRASLVRKGEKLNIEELIPPHPLSDANGALQLQITASQLPQFGVPGSPILRESPPIAMKLLSSGRAIVGWQQPDLRGYSSQSRTNTWEELRSELEQIAPLLAEIRSALKKPAFDFQLNYALGATLPLPHLARLRTTMQILNSSTLLHMHEQKFAPALECLFAQIALVRVLENEPMSQSVRGGFVQSAFRATWEALHAEGWSDGELAELQGRWESLRFLDPAVSGAIMERALRLRDIHWIQQSHQNYDAFMKAFFIGQTLPGSLNLPDDPIEAMHEFPRQAFRAVAVGVDAWSWRYFSSYRDEQGSLAQTQVAIEALRAAITNPCYVTVQSNVSAGFVKLGYPEANVEQGIHWCGYGLSLHDLFGDAGGALTRLCTRAFQAEAQRELVVAAIALERYRLRHGRAPPDLSALVPEFLHATPRDCMDDQSLRYKLNADSTITLYCIGLDGTDNDGDGSPADKPSGVPAGRWLGGCDWVWPQPATREETEKYNAGIGEQIRSKVRHR